MTPADSEWLQVMDLDDRGQYSQFKRGDILQVVVHRRWVSFMYFLP